MQYPRRVTGKRLALLLGLVLTGRHAAADEPARGPFDGWWDTIISCPNGNGALGFSYRFLSVVRDSVLHGEKGEKNQPGWLQLDGKIQGDGSATLYADGLVGAAPFAVGQRPAGTAYGYHVASQFSKDSGTGTRVEGRACSVVFTRRNP